MDESFLSEVFRDIEGFVLDSGYNDELVWGVVTKYNQHNQSIQLKITDGLHRMRYRKDRLYDIEFHKKRLPFQLQHKTLYWMKEHELFEVFINNPQYKTFCLPQINAPSDASTSPCQNIAYREGLNEEQRLAVSSIVGCNDKFNQLPFLLFGPPGEQVVK